MAVCYDPDKHIVGNFGFDWKPANGFKGW